MSLTTTEILSAICPALVTDPSYSVYVQMAEQRTSSCFFGANYTMAVALRAAHQFTLAQRTLGESGTISSKSESKISISFVNAVGAKDKALAQTHYGLTLLELIDATSPAASIAVTGILGGCN